jgi:virginiamycin B lyase
MPVQRVTLTLPVAVAIVALLSGCGGTSAPPVVPSAKAIHQVDISELGAKSIHASPNPDWITATSAGAWVANVNRGLVRYDDSGTITAEVPTGEIELAMDVGFGSLWLGSHTAEGFGVLRVDLDDPSKVTAISFGKDVIPSESSIGVTDDAVWVIAKESALSLASINPTTNARGLSFPAPPGASAVRGGFGSLWVTSHETAELIRIDPTTGATIARIPVGAGPQFLAVGTDAIWVMNQVDGSVSRVNPKSNTVVATVTVSPAPIDGGDIAAGPEAVWIRTTAELAVKVDPATSKVVDAIGPGSGSGSIAVAGSVVWISAHDVTTVWRLTR